MQRKKHTNNAKPLKPTPLHVLKHIKHHLAPKPLRIHTSYSMSHLKISTFSSEMCYHQGFHHEFKIC